MKNLIPEVRFPEFTGEWGEKKFGELYSFHTTNSLSRDKLNYENGKVYNIHYGDIHTKFKSHFYLQSENVPFVNEDVDLTRIKKDSFCKNGDLIIADASEDYEDIGKSIELIDINEVNLLAGLHTFLARPTSNYTALGFISCLLKSWKLRKQIMTIAQGTKVLSLSTTRVSELDLNLPSLSEQTKIASFLTAVDEKLTALNQKKTLLEHYKKGVMQQIFSQELRFKDDKGNDYADWEEKKLGEVAEKRIVKNKDNKISLVFTNSAVQGIVNQRDFFDKDIANKNNLTGYYVIENNDFIYNPRISSTAPVGPISRNHLETGIMSPLYSVFRFKTGNLDFIEKFFASSMWFKHMEDISNYGARDDRMSFSTGDFYKMPIPFPSLPEQTKIANFLSAIDVKVNHCQEQIDQSTIWKKGLLQQMFV
ncbi:restriction endonuclease subunit S [Flavobacterium sp. PL002]|uniref:restriction endonuclease subunit S n=1 Tax=Flavobacterium sp. PL002 TaxID=1897058 RepID=UPI0017879E47|nr:restriction endonuclease subunit S [Flavobacterium sp. PL002]MBE0392457.1 hypothetical protein [Flavobacterium sp. PL002]